jgi:Concanavalin A-like lectin/glucanases superfamily
MFNLGIGIGMSGGAGRPSADDPILVGLRNWWGMDGETGNEICSHSGDILTDNNACGSTAGIVGAARSTVTASSQYFNRDMNVTPSAAWSMSFWIKRKAAVDHVLMELSASGASTAFYVQYHSGANQCVFRVRNSLDGLQADYFGAAGQPAINAWGHIMIRSSGTVGRAKLNNGTELSITPTGGFCPPGFPINRLSIGGRPFAGYSTAEFDEIAFWDRELTDDECTRLYAAGAGIGYPG